MQLPKEGAGSLDIPVDRLLRRLEVRIDEIVDRMLTAFVQQIPAYAALPEPMLDEDIRIIVRDNVTEWFRIVRQQRAPNEDELAEFVASARLRAHQGIPLEALLHAYRLGATVAWEVILEESQGGRAVDLKAALAVAGGLMRYLDHVSTAVAQGYLEEREHMVVDQERRHLEIVEFLLDHGSSSPETESRFAEAGLKAASAYCVVVVTCDVRPQGLRHVAQRVREWDSPVPVIAMTWESGVLALWPADDVDLRRELEALRVELVEERGDVLIAIAGPAAGPLRDLFNEVRALIQAGTHGSGIIRLEDFPLEVLIQGAGGRVAGVIRGYIERVQQYDQKNNTQLVGTLRTYIECNASLRDTARALMVHRNTVAYRLQRIGNLTGLNPRHLPHIFLLHAGLESKESDSAPGGV